MSDEEHSGDEKKPSEAELALQKRRKVTKQHSTGLDDEAKELLETNRQDRERMEDEIQELRKRNEKRKKEREVEEKRLAAERAAEDERRKAVDEAKRRQKEEEEAKRKKDRESKKAEYDKFANASKPNFVISKREDGGSGGGEGEEEGQGVVKKSREQLEKEKKAILKQRIVELKVDGLDQSGLSDKAKELHKLIYRLECEKYDLEKRFKMQQVEMMELAERARQANRVGKEGVKRVVLGEGESDTIQERFAGAPAKIEMYSKYERQKDKRDYKERKTVYVGPQFILPPDRIKPTKIIKWGEQGLPVYEELPAGGEHVEEQAAHE